MGRHLLDEADRRRAAQNARRDGAAERRMSRLERRVHDLAPIERDQRCLGPAMVFLARERRMRGRKQLQGLLPRAFLVLAGESPEPFPDRRLDDFDRDRTQGDCRFDRADRPSVFETRRRALLRHRLRAFNQSADWFVPIDEVADGGDIDAFFGAGADRPECRCLDQRGAAPS